MSERLTPEQIAEIKTLQSSVDLLTLWIEDCGDNRKNPDCREYVLAVVNAAPALIAAAQREARLVELLRIAVDTMRQSNPQTAAEIEKELKP